MARPTNELPVKFSRIKAGKKYWSARYQGREIALGPDGSPQVAQRWATLLHQVAQSPGAVLRSDAVLIPEIFALYRNSPDYRSYRDADERFRRALILLTNADPLQYPGGPDYTELEVTQFTPPLFKAWRRWLAKLATPSGSLRYSKATVQKLCRMVLQVFSWGVTEGLLDGNTVASLREVLKLSLDAKPNQKGRPANPDHLAKILPHLPEGLRVAVQVQRLTASRPSEVLAITPGAILRTGIVEVPGFGQCDLGVAGLWVMPLTQHKNASKGKHRTIWFPRPAQELLAPLLAGEPNKPIFSPSADMQLRSRQRRAARKSKVTPSQLRRDAERKRVLGEQWTSHAYSLALKRASVKAGVPAVTAYQIRHLGKNELTRAHGIEVARLLLGHEKTDTTDLYGGRDYQLLANAINGE